MKPSDARKMLDAALRGIDPSAPKPGDDVTGGAMLAADIAATGALTGEGARDTVRRAVGLLLKVTLHAASGGAVEFTHPTWERPRKLKVKLRGAL